MFAAPLFWLAVVAAMAENAMMAVTDTSATISLIFISTVLRNLDLPAGRALTRLYSIAFTWWSSGYGCCVSNTPIETGSIGV
jgi:hypothetical protein